MSFFAHLNLLFFAFVSINLPIKAAETGLPSPYHQEGLQKTPFQEFHQEEQEKILFFAEQFVPRDFLSPVMTNI